MQANTTKTVSPAVRAAGMLNRHSRKTRTGFYVPGLTGRAFGARVRDEQLQVTSDFARWTSVDLASVVFRDHQGQQISL